MQVSRQAGGKCKGERQCRNARGAEPLQKLAAALEGGVGSSACSESHYRAAENLGSRDLGEYTHPLTHLKHDFDTALFWR